MVLEARIKPRNRARSALNIAVATIEKAPFPVKLAVGTVFGAGTIAILSGCSTQSKPCEIASNELTNERGGVCPITTYHYDNPGKILSAEDQIKLRNQYGADISDVYQWYAVPKGSNSESVGDGMVAFSTYYFKNGRSMVVFPSASEDYSSGKSEAYEFVSSLFESEDGKIIRSDNYPDKLNPGKVLSFLTIEYKKPEGFSLVDLAKDPSKLGIPEKVTISNPPANEWISYNVNSKNPDDKKLIEEIAYLFNSEPSVAHALGESTAIKPAPTEAPTAVPTIAPVEVAPGEFVPASQIVGYEARDTSGKLIYVEDIEGNWIKVTHEVKVAPATPEDWTNLNTRLGTDFAINTDGVIPGVDGVTVNKENGEVTFNFDGKGPETYHIGNIKTQEINGVKRLLVAGYSWNAETKSWEVFNPGFQMEDPSLTGWFIEVDVSNGNWLRWHQRATEGIDIKALFPSDTRVDRWSPLEIILDKNGPDKLIHYNKLNWINNQIDETERINNGIRKDQYPGRAGLSYGYMADSSCMIISFDALNGDRSTTSLPMLMDDNLWTEHKTDGYFTRVALAAGREWDESMVVKENMFKNANNPESWILWPVVSVYPDSKMSTGSLGQDDLDILKDPQAAFRREASIKINKIDQSASLEIWGSGVFVNYNK